MSQSAVLVRGPPPVGRVAASGSVEGRSVIPDVTAVPEGSEEDGKLEDSLRLTRAATAAGLLLQLCGRHLCSLPTSNLPTSYLYISCSNHKITSA